MTLEDWGSRTRYSVRTMHTSPQSRRQHEEMGFYDGWATALERLVDLVEAGQEA